MRTTFWSAIFTTTLLSIVIFFLVATETGLRWLGKQSLSLLPSQLALGKISGKLIGPIRIEQLRYHDSKQTIEFHHVYLDWKPSELLDHIIHVTHLSAKNISIRKHEETSSTVTSPRTNFQLPLPSKLAIQLDKVSADQIILVTKNTQTPMVFQNLLLSAAWDQSILKLSHCSVKMPGLTAHLRGQYDSLQNRINGQFSWSKKTKDIFEILAKGSLHGSLEKLKLTQHSQAPIHTTLVANVSNLLNQPHWQATLTVPSFDLTALNPQWPNATVDATVSLQGNLSTTQLAGQLNAHHPKTGLIHSQLKLKTNNFQKITVDQLKIKLAEHKSSIQAQGLLDYSNPFTANLTGQWDKLRWPLSNTPIIQADSGQFSLQGNLRHYQAQITTNIAGTQLPNSPLKATLIGDLQQIQVKKMVINTLDGELSAQGKMRWHPFLQWEAHLQSHAINPQAFRTELPPGEIHSIIEITGEYTKPSVNTHIHIQQLNGTLNQRPLSAQAIIDIHNRNIQLQDVTIRSGKDTLHVHGNITDIWDLNWSVHVNNINHYLTNASGSLASFGEITGPRNQPRIIVDLGLQQMQFDNTNIESITAALDIDLLGQQKSNAAIHLDTITSGLHQIDQITLAGTGIIDDHQLSIIIQKDYNYLELNAIGGFEQQQWSGIVDHININSVDFGLWKTTSPSTLSISAHHAKLNDICLAQAPTTLCTSATWQKHYSSQLTINLIDLPTSFFRTFMPSNIDWKDHISADLHLSLLGTEINQLTGKIKLGAGNILAKQIAGENISFPYQPSFIHFEHNKSTLKTQFELPFENGDSVQGWLNLPEFRHINVNPQQKNISGNIQANINDLNLISLFVPVISNIQGKAQALFSISGKLASPKLHGQLDINQASLDIIDLGIHIHDISINAQTDKDHVLQWQAQGKSGGGSVAMTGNTDLNPKHHWQTALNIKANTFEIFKKPEFWLFANSDFNITYHDKLVTYDGEIVIPRGKIDLRDSTSKITSSDDVIIVSGGQTNTNKKLKTSANVRLVINDRLFFEGFGLTSYLTGDLVINKTPEKITTGSGELNIIKGDYKAFGTELEIKHGKLIFAGGAIANPALDIKARRTFKDQDITTGIHATGRLKSPELTLYSEPTMSEKDILYYLVLGRASSEASPEEADALVTAAAALSTSQGYIIAKNLAHQLGIEETRFNRRGLVLGRSLSPRLSISYEIGLFESSNVFQVRYILSKLWQIKSETGTDKSQIDFLYSIEK